MANVLKAFIVLLLLLSGASLFLGYKLFDQREQLKARILNYEDAVEDFATKLHYDKINKSQLKDHNGMKSPLKLLAAHADTTWVELQDTLAQLDETKMQLAETRDELESTKSQLAAARDQINTLEETIVGKDEEIGRKEGQITGLEQEKEGLLTEIQGYKNEISEKEQMIAEMNDEIIQLKDEIARITPTGPGDKPEIEEGAGGTIVLVNADWNFVVLDIGRENGLLPNTQLQVHRESKLIGVVQVTNLEDYRCVASIVNTYDLFDLQVGDAVIYIDMKTAPTGDEKKEGPATDQASVR